MTDGREDVSGPPSDTAGLYLFFLWNSRTSLPRLPHDETGRGAGGVEMRTGANTGLLEHEGR